MLVRNVLISALFISAVACGGTAEGQPIPGDNKRTDPSPAEEDDGFPAYTKGWPETDVTTAAWPYFGSANTGVVIAPRWVAPAQLGCGQRRRVRNEPSRNFVSARAAAAKSDSRPRSATELRLTSLQPEAIFEFSTQTDAADDAQLAVTVKE